MNPEKFEKSHNQLPWSSDWHRYDTPAVLRKHGRNYMERFWRSGVTELKTHQLKSDHLATLEGGEIFISGEPVCIRVDLHLTRRVDL